VRIRVRVADSWSLRVSCGAVECRWGCVVCRLCRRVHGLHGGCPERQLQWTLPGRSVEPCRRQQLQPVPRGAVRQRDGHDIAQLYRVV
jgi:hypothetical protein